ncbi:hypothetical protein [Parvularcula oceani]|uniref:hypothetical protein n=1 Tax=Parvularcula oceani TaxID=1247963 RepID=UPI0012DF2601|nr:hypothetical protein [Parvularcula oceani]
MVAFEAVEQVSDSKGRKKVTRSIASDLKSFCEAAYKNLKKDIGSNNGIKAKDQAYLLERVGLPPHEVDLPTSNALDAFGIKRGKVAHSLRIRTDETKSAILNDVKTIAAGLRLFDEAALEVTQQQMAP